MSTSLSDRLIATPSPYAKSHYLYVQESGTLQSIKPHISSRKGLSSYLFFLVLSGNGRFFYDGQPFILRQGHCVWIDCTLPYSHESSPEHPWELKWVHFQGKEAPEFYRLYKEQGFPCVFMPSNPGGFNETLSILHSLHKKDNTYRELVSHKYLTDIISMCFTENTPLYKSSSGMAEKLSEVRSYLKNHFSERLSLDGLAAHFFVSKYHLSRTYRQAFGTTIGNDLNSLRISHAKSLLRFTGLPVEEIAAACGWPDANYFAKVFKKSENMTPLEYRRRW